MSNFYIKRINNGKHVLHVDSINNFNNVKELLTKCNTRFYTYTTKTYYVTSKRSKLFILGRGSTKRTDFPKHRKRGI